MSEQSHQQSRPTLTPDELFDITGYRRPTYQAAWLKANGFKFKLNAQLRPKVDRMHYLQKMGASPRDNNASEPDWNALGAAT